MSDDVQTAPTKPLLAIVSDLVSSYVANNSVRAADFASLIETSYAAIHALSNESGAPAAQKQEPTPAVAIRKSVNHDHIVCLEDGLKFKSLKRHLTTVHDLTPAEYRQKWSLPTTYPMVAPEYAAQRSALAKEIGLGAAGRPKSVPKPQATRGRGRPRKSA